MTSAAQMTTLLNWPVNPFFRSQHQKYLKLFKELREGEIRQEPVKNVTRSQIYGLDWCDDGGDRLLVITKDGKIKLLNPNQLYGAAEERRWDGDWQDCKTDPGSSGHVAACVAREGKFKTFDVRAKDSSIHELHLKKHSEKMTGFLSLCWHPNSLYVTLTTRHDQIFTLDLRKQKQLCLGPSMALNMEVTGAVWGNSENLWVGQGGFPGRISVYDNTLSKEISASFVGHQYSINSMAASKATNEVCTGGGDCLVALWDAQSLTCKKTFAQPTQPVTCVGFSHDGNLLAWGTGKDSDNPAGEKCLAIAGTNTGYYYTDGVTTTSPVSHLAWHPTKTILAYAVNEALLPPDNRARDRSPARHGSHRERSRERHRDEDGQAVLHILRLHESKHESKG